MTKTEIDKLIYLFSKLPGLGPRSSRRVILHLLKNKDKIMLPLAELIKTTANTMQECQNCGNLDISKSCSICSNQNRDHQTICVVESVADLWAIERGEIFKGIYHVLGGNLSIESNRTPSELSFAKLLKRVEQNNIIELILATNATIEGQTTAYYITELLKDQQVKISRLAHGIPIGGELDYLDEGTLGAALKSRQPF